MNGLSDSQVRRLRERLEDECRELERLLENSESFGLQDSLREQSGDLSTYDNHPGDAGTETYDRGKDLALLENAERLLADAHEALARMERGEYGKCAACGQPIPYERLEAVPSTSYCIEHVPDKYVSERRPVEEKLMSAPFGRTSFDEQSNQTAFDGEDAWQIVERWGDSTSPAFAEYPNAEGYDALMIEADEEDGYVEAIESFLATDLYGRHVQVVRNRKYREYMSNGEGDPLLEPEPFVEEDELGNRNEPDLSDGS